MQPIPSIRLRGAVALLAGTAIGMAYHPAAAQVSTGGWAFDLAAYGWFTAMTGAVGAGSVRAKVDNNLDCDGVTDETPPAWGEGGGDGAADGWSDTL